MTIYETVKAAVTVRTAAEHYGLDVNRNGMTCCPFHLVGASSISFTPPQAALAKPRYPMIKAFREDELYCHRVLCDYLHLLESRKVQYAPKTPEEPWDDRFTESLQMHDYIEYLADVLTVGESVQ